MQMSKLLIVHKINDENDRPVLEQGFSRYHVPEVMMQNPLTLRYLMYRVIPAPPAKLDPQCGWSNQGFKQNDSYKRSYGAWSIDIGSRRVEVRSRRVEVGSLREDIGSRRVEVGSRRAGVG
jgi:hypothetical protein